MRAAAVPPLGLRVQQIRADAWHYFAVEARAKYLSTSLIPRVKLVRFADMAVKVLPHLDGETTIQLVRFFCMIYNFFNNLMHELEFFQNLTWYQIGLSVESFTSELLVLYLQKNFLFNITVGGRIIIFATIKTKGLIKTKPLAFAANSFLADFNIRETERSI